jgi:hypothetical protein
MLIFNRSMFRLSTFAKPCFAQSYIGQELWRDRWLNDPFIYLEVFLTPITSFTGLLRFASQPRKRSKKDFFVAVSRKTGYFLVKILLTLYVFLIEFVRSKPIELIFKSFSFEETPP